MWLPMTFEKSFSFDKQSGLKATDVLEFIYMHIIVNTCLVPLVPSVLWHCWLGSRKGIRPLKNWVMGCWRGYLSGARCRLAYGPADATATRRLYASVKSRLVLPFWYRLTQVVLDKGPLNGVCVCVCVCVCYFLLSLLFILRVGLMVKCIKKDMRLKYCAEHKMPEINLFASITCCNFTPSAFCQMKYA